MAQGPFSYANKADEIADLRILCGCSDCPNGNECPKGLENLQDCEAMLNGREK